LRCARIHAQRSLVGHFASLNGLSHTEFWHLRQGVPFRREMTAKQSWMEDLCVRLQAKDGNISVGATTWVLL
jgi:hypothetical protein